MTLTASWLHGYLSKALTARELVAALESVHAGEIVDAPMDRQALYLRPNTVKSYIRGFYRKIDVESRTQAVLWGVDHGFLPDKRRIEHWRGGP